MGVKLYISPGCPDCWLLLLAEASIPVLITFLIFASCAHLAPRGQDEEIEACCGCVGSD